MTKLPEDIKHLNLTNTEYEKLSDSDKKRIMTELPCNDAMYFSEANPNSDVDLSKLPIVVDGFLLY